MYSKDDLIEGWIGADVVSILRLAKTRWRHSEMRYCHVGVTMFEFCSDVVKEKLNKSENS